MGKIRDELERKQLLAQDKRKSFLQIPYQTCRKVMKKGKKGTRVGVRVTHGIIVNDLKINIYEMKKEYEVHVIFNSANGDLVFEERLDGTIDYLAQEGYFDKKKKIKVIGMAFKGSMDNGSFFKGNE